MTPIMDITLDCKASQNMLMREEMVEYRLIFCNLRRGKKMPFKMLSWFGILQSLGNLARPSNVQADGTGEDVLQTTNDGKTQKKGPKFERLRLTSGGHESGLHVSPSFLSEQDSSKHLQGSQWISVTKSVLF